MTPIRLHVAMLPTLLHPIPAPPCPSKCDTLLSAAPVLSPRDCKCWAPSPRRPCLFKYTLCTTAAQHLLNTSCRREAPSRDQAHHTCPATATPTAQSTVRQAALQRLLKIAAVSRTDVQLLTTYKRGRTQQAAAQQGSICPTKRGPTKCRCNTKDLRHS